MRHIGMSKRACHRGKFAQVGRLFASSLAISVLMTFAATVVWGQQTYSETILASFNGTNGANPMGALLQTAGGSFYGTTSAGGANNLGTVFKIDSGGTLTTLYSFGSSTTDGSTPKGSLVQLTGGTGLLYGTTELGGLYGMGTVFSVSQDGVVTIVYNFGATASDGANPWAALTASHDGTTLYGTTANGGSSGLGTVFSMTPMGQENWVYSFCSSNDGVQPLAPVIDGGDGYLYGTTSGGGPGGTVFKIPYAGAQPCSDVILLQGPNSNFNYGTSAALLLGTDGNFYGVTQGSGSGPDGGVLFELTQSDEFSVLHTFGYGTPDPDGSDPAYALIQGTSGAFYGTTAAGGANGGGTLFSFSTGTLTTLYNFGASASDGKSPNGIIQGVDGGFYGTTYSGGSAGDGILFKVAVGTASTTPATGSGSSGSGGGGAFGMFSVLWLGSLLIINLGLGVQKQR
jgi:uncharacterized repeat protein (TIGR03803 family)